MSTISAGTTSTTTLIHSGDTTGSLVLKTNDTGSGGTTAVTINTSQNVGIGTSSPSARVDNTGTFRSTGATDPSSGTGLELSYRSTYGDVLAYNRTSSAFVQLQIRGEPIIFGNSGGERMRIDSSGNVGIGVTPSYRLEVKGPSATAGQLSIHDGTGDTTVSGNNAASLLFQTRDTSVRTIAEIDAVNTTTNGTGGAMVFQTRISDTLAERMRINGGAPILCLQGGNTSATGTGIAFPATQSASSDVNTLDDYEEGTWTPVITGTTTAGSATYSTQSGTYVKIGKYVFLQMFVVFTSAHTGTGGTKVGGFPFTIGSNFGGGGTITYKTAWVTNGPDFMQGEATTTFGYLRYDTNTSQQDITPNVNIQNTTGFMQSIWYLSDN